MKRSKPHQQNKTDDVLFNYLQDVKRNTDAIAKTITKTINQERYLYFAARCLPAISVASIYGNSAQSQNRYVFSPTI